MRRLLTEDEQHRIAGAIVKELEPSNWRPVREVGAFESEENTLSIGPKSECIYDSRATRKKKLSATLRLKYDRVGFCRLAHLQNPLRSAMQAIP
jgi:hypothetical protein